MERLVCEGPRIYPPEQILLHTTKRACREGKKRGANTECLPFVEYVPGYHKQTVHSNNVLSWPTLAILIR